MRSSDAPKYLCGGDAISVVVRKNSPNMRLELRHDAFKTAARQFSVKAFETSAFSRGVEARAFVLAAWRHCSPPATRLDDAQPRCSKTT